MEKPGNTTSQFWTMVRWIGPTNTVWRYDLSNLIKKLYADGQRRWTSIWHKSLRNILSKRDRGGLLYFSVLFLAESTSSKAPQSSWNGIKPCLPQSRRNGHWMKWPSLLFYWIMLQVISGRAAQIRAFERRWEYLFIYGDFFFPQEMVAICKWVRTGGGSCRALKL